MLFNQPPYLFRRFLILLLVYVVPPLDGRHASMTFERETHPLDVLLVVGPPAIQDLLLFQSCHDEHDGDLSFAYYATEQVKVDTNYVRESTPTHTVYDEVDADTLDQIG